MILVDLEMWIHLLAEHRFAYLSEPLCAFRQHSAQQTAVNRRRIAPGTEELMLLADCRRQRWFPQITTRGLLFANIHKYGHLPNASGQQLMAVFKRELGPGWHVFFWTQRKLINPLHKLARWLYHAATGKPKRKNQNPIKAHG